MLSTRLEWGAPVDDHHRDDATSGRSTAAHCTAADAYGRALQTSVQPTVFLFYAYLLSNCSCPYILSSTKRTLRQSSYHSNILSEYQKNVICHEMGRITQYKYQQIRRQHFLILSWYCNNLNGILIPSLIQLFLYCIFCPLLSCIQPKVDRTYELPQEEEPDRKGHKKAV